MDSVQVWSSGGGVQSTAIAILISQKKLEIPDISCIVDTEFEASSTWDYSEKYVEPLLETLNIKLHKIKKSDWSNVGLFGGKEKNTILIPVFQLKENGKMGKSPTYCSSEWKKFPLRRFVNSSMPAKKYFVWFGFSTDEKHRAERLKVSKKWDARFPLLELSMSRQDCLDLIESVGWPLPIRSGCWMCPNRSKKSWLELKETKDWKKAVDFEKDIQKRNKTIFLTPYGNLDSLEQEDEYIFGDSCSSGMCFV